MKLKLRFNGRKGSMRYGLKMSLEPSTLSVWRVVVRQAEAALRQEFPDVELRGISITIAPPRKGRKR